MLVNAFLDLLDVFKYDVLRLPLPEASGFSWDKLHLTLVPHHKKGEGYWVKAKEYPGLVASGDTLEELREAVFDSILTYFDVPRATAKRMRDLLVLNLPNGTKFVPPDKIKFFEVKLARA